MAAIVRLYWEVAKRSFQRQLAYRTANLAGLVTNAFFGYVRAAVLVAFLQGRGEVAGYDAQAAMTYSWVTQALIMVVALWGWWEIETTIRTGDVVSDLSKPFSYLAFWLARDYGRAAYYLLFRALPILLVGQLTFGLRWPSSPLSWAAFALSLVLAVTVSFGWRFLLNVSAFWTADARGIGYLMMAVLLFLGGFAVPVHFFPPWLRDLALALPFVSITQIPADIFLERVGGPALAATLLQQALWAAAMLGAARALLALAMRRVVTQGG